MTITIRIDRVTTIGTPHPLERSGTSTYSVTASCLATLRQFLRHHSTPLSLLILPGQLEDRESILRIDAAEARLPRPTLPPGFSPCRPLSFLLARRRRATLQELARQAAVFSVPIQNVESLLSWAFFVLPLLLRSRWGFRRDMHQRRDG